MSDQLSETLRLDREQKELGEIRALIKPKDTACAILDDLFKTGDWPVRRIEDHGHDWYCGWCGEGEDDRGEIAHLDTYPYSRYRKMVEEEK
jgi:hypothetical protein